jgi:hypothetical protein
MKESYGKDPASHPDPESCVGGRGSGDTIHNSAGFRGSRGGIGRERQALQILGYRLNYLAQIGYGRPSQTSRQKTVGV